MTITYEKTVDPNVVAEVREVRTEIHLDKLTRQIRDLETQLAAVPEPKTEPDQETLEFWNDHQARALDAEGLQARIRQKKELLAAAEKAGAAEMKAKS